MRNRELSELISTFVATVSRDHLWYKQELDELLAQTMSADTACPDKQEEWTPEDPTLGHDDLVAYLMAVHYHGGMIAGMKPFFRSERPSEINSDPDFIHFINWRPNGEGVTPYNHCSSRGMGQTEATRTWEPSGFLAWADGRGWNLSSRYERFEERLVRNLKACLDV